MEQYIEYLRKSRFDRDYLDLSVEETLKRHQEILDRLARDRGFYIAKVYREVVSGESIAARPEVQKMLEEVSSGIYTGVLVVDVERLARGCSLSMWSVWPAATARIRRISARSFSSRTPRSSPLPRPTTRRTNLIRSISFSVGPISCLHFVSVLNSNMVIYLHKNPMESVVYVELEDRLRQIMRVGKVVFILKMNAMIELTTIDLILLGELRRIDSVNAIDTKTDKKERRLDIKSFLLFLFLIS